MRSSISMTIMLSSKFKIQNWRTSMLLALSLTWRSPPFFFLKMLPALLKATNIFLKTIHVFLKTTGEGHPRGQWLEHFTDSPIYAVTMATMESSEDCFGNIFSENYNKNHCKNCYNGICSFLTMPGKKQFFKNIMWTLSCNLIILLTLTTQEI